MEDCTSLGQHKRRLNYPSKLRSTAATRKDHAVSASSEDEALDRYSVSSEVPRFVLRFEMVLDTLMRPQKFPDIPVSLEGNTEVLGTNSSEPLLLS